MRSAQIRIGWWRRAAQPRSLFVLMTRSMTDSREVYSVHHGEEARETANTSPRDAAQVRLSLILSSLDLGRVTPVHI
jgi:hypothetical protein